MTKRRVRIVVNPSARSGRGPRALRGLDTSALEVDWQISLSAAHLGELVAEAEQSGCHDAVAVAGGDGSVRHALAALGVPNRIPFGVIPIGTGNDFARDAGIPADAGQAMQVLADGVAREIDLGRAGDTRYCCVASVGLDEVALDVVHHSGLPRGKALNVVAALWAIMTYRPRRLRIRWEGGELEENVMFAAVTNTRGYGGGILVSPAARVDDGSLDLCIVRQAGRLALLSRFGHILRGTHAGLPQVVMARSPWVTIEDPGGGLRAALDGELPDTAAPLDIRCQPGGLRLLVPCEEELS